MLLYQNMDDVALWNLLAKGDMEAVEILYKRYYELLFNYGLKYYQDEAFVEDCIQDLFVKLCENTHLSSVIYVKAYLLRALRNTAFDKITQRKSTEQLNEIKFNLVVDDAAMERYFKEDDRDLLWSRQLLCSYRKLSAHHQQAIYLRYVQNLSYKEIAEVLEMNLQSAHNLVFRAMEKLRSKFVLNQLPLLAFLFFFK